MKTVKYTKNETKLRVVGTLWSGARARYDYLIITEGPEKKIPTNLAAAKAIAEDFESLESATLVNTVRFVTETVTNTKLK